MSATEYIGTCIYWIFLPSPDHINMGNVSVLLCKTFAIDSSSHSKLMLHSSHVIES